MQTEQRHEVHRRQRLRRCLVEVAEVVAAQPGRVEQLGVEPRVHAVVPAAAELVELDGHERGLGLPAQARNDPRVRVGLLEVVDRAQREVLAHLRPRALVAQPVAGTRPVDRFHQEFVERSRDVGVTSPAGDVGAQRREEPLLQRRTQAQQVRVPLPVGCGVGEAAVVQFVAGLQGQLQVVAVRVGITDVDREGGAAGFVAQRRHHGRGERATGQWQGGHLGGCRHGCLGSRTHTRTHTSGLPGPSTRYTAPRARPQAQASVADR